MERKKFKNVYTGIAAVYLLLLVLRGGKCWTVAEDYCYRLAWPSLAWPGLAWPGLLSHSFWQLLMIFTNFSQHFRMSRKYIRKYFTSFFFAKKMQNFAKKVCEI